MTALNKRLLIWLVIAGLLCIGLFLSFRPQPVAVDLVNVQPGPMRVTVTEEGQTRVHDMYILSSPVGGHLRRIEAHAGDPVIAGETVLASIQPGDPVLLDSRTEAQARSALQAAESARVLAQAGVEQAEAELEFAQSEWRRANELVANGTTNETRDLRFFFTDECETER